MKKNKIKFVCAVALSSVAAQLSFAQMVIAPHSELNSSHALISLNCDFENESVNVHLSNSNLFLVGMNQAISSTHDLSVEKLEVQGGGEKNISGNWEVKSKLILTEGLINVSSFSRLLFSGVQEQPVGHADSYVLGKFYSQGVGMRKFPIGTASGYFPLMLTDVKESVLIGAETVEGDAGLTFTDPELTQGFDDRYWKLESAPTFSGSPVGLSSLNIPISNPVIVASEQIGGRAINIGRHSQDSEYIISAQQVLSKHTILTYSGVQKINIVVRNLITPNEDGDNDALFIEEIEQYPDNLVMLINRYGEKVKEWSAYKNDSDFNFASLGAGNYVCILKFTSSGRAREISQMITIIK